MHTQNRFSLLIIIAASLLLSRPIQGSESDTRANIPSLSPLREVTQPLEFYLRQEAQYRYLVPLKESSQEKVKRCAEHRHNYTVMLPQQFQKAYNKGLRLKNMPAPVNESGKRQWNQIEAGVERHVKEGKAITPDQKAQNYLNYLILKLADEVKALQTKEGKDSKEIATQAVKNVLRLVEPYLDTPPSRIEPPQYLSFEEAKKLLIERLPDAVETLQNLNPSVAEKKTLEIIKMAAERVLKSLPIRERDKNIFLQKIPEIKLRKKNITKQKSDQGTPKPAPTLPYYLRRVQQGTIGLVLLSALYYSSLLFYRFLSPPLRLLCPRDKKEPKKQQEKPLVPHEKKETSAPA
jgi:hypothetical protein